MSTIEESVNGAGDLPDDPVSNIIQISDHVKREKKIQEEAKKLGVSRAAIRDEVKRREKSGDGGSGNGSTRTIELPHWAVDPWPHQVDAAELVETIVARLSSHVAATKEVILTTALWIPFAWAHDAFVHSPMLLATSPEPECGKSTLLGLVSYLTPRGMVIVEISPAVLFRMIEHSHPTLIIDEADDLFRSDPVLRSIVNSGWTRGAGVPRCHPDTHEPEFFMTFGPKAIGIKGLKVPPPTLSRSIVVGMRRKLPGDEVINFLHQDDDGLRRLRQQLARFAQDNMEKLRRAEPEMPEGFSNRLEANWKPLLAIAEMCGKGSEAREAAKSLSHRANETSVRVELLGDIVDIIEKHGGERMHSEDIVSELHNMENRQWAEWGYKNPKPISKNQVAKLLEPFGIAPEQMKIDGLNRNGYALRALKPELTRYRNSTALHPLVDKGLREIPSSTDEAEVEFQNTRNPLETKAGRAVELQNTPSARVKMQEGQKSAICAHCHGHAEAGNPVMPTTVDVGVMLPLHMNCHRPYFKQARGEQS